MEVILTMADNRRQYIRALATLSRDARLLLLRARETLGSARNWGILDMLGGSSIVGLVKHSKIDNAMRLVDQARPLLHEIGEALSHLRLDAQIAPGVSGLATLADFFIDGIFADVYVQSKIRDLQLQLDEALRQLDRVDAALRTANQDNR